jgi:hypothetical protein
MPDRRPHIAVNAGRQEELTMHRGKSDLHLSARASMLGRIMTMCRQVTSTVHPARVHFADLMYTP